MNIVVLGGGTGTFTALTGLKAHRELNLAAVVSCADNGGSSGTLRDEYGGLPPGDLRQCLVALAESGPEMRDLFGYRFDDGPFATHPIGNILLSALQRMTGDPFEAVRIAQRLLSVRGRVIPVSRLAGDLVAELEDGRHIRGEHEIDMRVSIEMVARCFLENPVEGNPEAIEAIHGADIVVLGPGDLHTSLIPVLLVGGIREALHETRAKRVYVLNLTTKPGATEGFAASRFVNELSGYLLPATIDRVLVNSSVPEPELVVRYEAVREGLVVDDLGDDQRVMRWPLLDADGITPRAGDPIRRSYLRHHPASLALAILAAASATP